MRLEELQRALASSLVTAAPPPEGCDASQVARARRSLQLKRGRAAAHLLPRLRRTLGTTWHDRFSAHAGSYQPAGLLYHVDDAWAFAETLARSGDRATRVAAHDDLLDLKLRYVREGTDGPSKIRGRRAPLLALSHSRPRALVVRLPGTSASVWFLPLF
jgi:hypothetical protein